MDDLIPNLTKTPNNKVTTWRIFFSRGWYSHFCKVKPGFGEKVREKNPQKLGEGFISKRWLSFNQFEKYAQVNWIISRNFGVQEKNIWVDTT